MSALTSCPSTVNSPPTVKSIYILCAGNCWFVLSVNKTDKSLANLKLKLIDTFLKKEQDNWNRA